jgi:hypothetical protein
MLRLTYHVIQFNSKLETQLVKLFLSCIEKEKAPLKSADNVWIGSAFSSKMQVLMIYTAHTLYTPSGGPMLNKLEKLTGSNRKETTW